MSSTQLTARLVGFWLFYGKTRRWMSGNVIVKYVDGYRYVILADLSQLILHY